MHILLNMLKISLQTIVFNVWEVGERGDVSSPQTGGGEGPVFLMYTVSVLLTCSFEGLD